MLHIKWKELFPSKLSAIIFVAYMALFVNHGVLVTASQNTNKKYSYDTTLVVLLTEVIKLLVSALLYCINDTFQSMIIVIKENVNLLVLYFIPALLYCFYNNLAFINLSTFDPTSYYLLLQFRVVITAFLFQLIFKKYLTLKQWIALVTLTIGCMIKHVDVSSANEKKEEDNMMNQMFSISALLILIQTFCSSLAGVYNEYLLKNKGLTVNIYIQNVFMYFDSVICNIIVVILQGKTTSVINIDTFYNIIHWNVLLIILNSTAVGVVTSFFLKNLNSILKTFASALELIFTAIICLILFNIPISGFTILSILIVSISIVIYSQNPVDNQPKEIKQYKDQIPLMEEGLND